MTPLRILRAGSVLLLCASFAASAQNARTVADTELKAEPNRSAAKVATLPAGTSVDSGERRGGWYAVTSDQGKGWLPMSSLSFGSGEKQGSSGLGKLVNLANTGKSGSTVATGVRGHKPINAATLQGASADPEALARVEAIAPPEEVVKRFAKQEKLRTTQIEYPAPPAPKSEVSTDEVKF